MKKIDCDEVDALKLQLAAALKDKAEFEYSLRKLEWEKAQGMFAAKYGVDMIGTSTVRLDTGEVTTKEEAAG